jgi:predicted nucleotidyltransferase
MLRQVDFSAAGTVFSRSSNILTVWVFGSAREGMVRVGSDIDFGVLFAGKPSLDEMAGLRADMQDALRFDDIDLVVLNEAHPLLRFEAVSGKRLFCRDEAQTASFVSLTAREYEDAMAFLQSGLSYQNAADHG